MITCPRNPPLQVLIAVLALLLAGSTFAATVLDAQEYAVFTALLEHGMDPDSGRIVLDAYTTGDPAGILAGGGPDEARANALGTTVELLRDWSLMNERRHALEPAFKLRQAVSLLTDEERRLLFPEDLPAAGWQRFFSKYPGSAGIVRLSRVGFDVARTRALVYLEFQCGPECGSGRLVQLGRVPGAPWRVESGELLWIAAPTSESPASPAGSPPGPPSP